MSHAKQITGRQIAAARSLLGLGQDQLATKAEISIQRLQSVEAGGEDAMPDEIAAIMRALQSAGIAFIDDNQTSSAGGPGLRLLKSPGEFDTDQSQTVQYKEHLAPDAPTGAGG